MGVVYLCDDRVSHDRVALKCVFVDRAQDVKSKDAVWFKQEARALATLDHPAIVRARDFGTLPDGSPYLVMDALTGRSVHVWKYLTRIPWPTVWSVMDQVLAGLAHAHARGIIHGDLKPSNILIDPRNGQEEPSAFILDLGLAWLLADHVDPRLSRNTADAPTMPFGLGTPGWMAPEQIRHQVAHIGPATDLYALGSILFELLMRREMYEGTPSEILRKHRDDPVPEFTLPEDTPAGVASFLRKMLEKKPWKRFRLAADARAVWQTFKPMSPVRWAAPKVRFRDEQPDSLRSIPAAPSSRDIDGLKVAPGILAFRPSPLVGREHETQALLQIVKEATAPDKPAFTFVLLRGEAGVGKSRLAEWLCETVHEHGIAIPLKARYRRTPGPQDGMRGAVSGYYNFAALQRDAIEQALLNEWEVGGEEDPLRTWVAGAAAWLRPPNADETLTIGPAGKRFLIDKPELRWVVIRQVVNQISTRAGTTQPRPILLWLDDFHLAPPGSYTGLRQLLHEDTNTHIVVVITAREEAMLAKPELAHRLEELVASYASKTIRLVPLGEDATRSLLRASLRLTPSAEDSVVARSKGNPLFALQLVHAWASGGFLKLSDEGYSVDATALHGRATTTADLWDERLAALPEAYRPAAFGAAALGEVLDRMVVNHLFDNLGYDSRGCVDALMQAQILLPQGIQGHGQMRWPHALLQEHLFARLANSPDAARVFRAAADALAIHPSANNRRLVRQRVSNLLYAGDRKAASALLISYVARAWTFLRDVSATRTDLSMLDGYIDAEYVSHHTRWRAEAERHAGNLSDARKLAEEARQMFAQAEDRENEAHCLRLLAHIASDQGAPALGRIEAVLARSMFESLGNIVGKAQVELVLGEIDYLLGDHASARKILASAAGACRKTGDRLGLAQCLILQSLAAQAVGQIDNAIELLKEARKEFDDLGYQLGLAQVDIVLAHAHHRAGRLDTAYESGLKTRSIMRNLDTPRGEAACERLCAMAALDLNRLMTARTHARAAYILYDTRLADTWGRVEGLLLLAQVALAEKDLLDAQSHIDAARSIHVDEAEPVQHRYLTIAWFELLSNHPEQAAEAIEEARATFPDRRRTADHTPHLIDRLLAVAHGTVAEAPLQSWRRAIEESPATATPLPI